jgi:glycosyltransferase involved in cell wall biosynthesis
MNPEKYPIRKSANFSNTCVILPIYNSEKHLPRLITAIIRYFPPSQIIAVDDGSSDGSRQICQNMDVSMITFAQNQGKGSALMAGMLKARADGYNFAFTIDSDEQHPPHHIPEFITLQNKNKCGLVLGKRNFEPDIMPRSRIWSNRITSKLVSAAAGRHIPDSQCGYRLYYLEPLQKIFLRSQRYQFETEILLKMAKLNIEICSLPIDTVYGDEVSHIRHLRDITNFIKIISSHYLSFPRY